MVEGDFEGLISKTGSNDIYMAAWYNGLDYFEYNLDDFGMNTNEMLSYFWQDLIEYNRGRICYFHNWGGYDSILSLPSLLNLPKNLEFNPIVKDGFIYKTITYLQLKIHSEFYQAPYLN